jgi:hypothetical protein
MEDVFVENASSPALLLLPMKDILWEFMPACIAMHAGKAMEETTIENSILMTPAKG